MHTDTAAVIAGSLMVWRLVAADRSWRSDALPHLYRQVRIWHDLTVSNRDRFWVGLRGVGKAAVPDVEKA